MKKISIIVPVLNEAAILPELFRHLEAQSSEEAVHEVILVDGGSRDQGLALMRSWVQCSEGAFRRSLMTSGRGRGRQMNAGEKKAGGGALLFLHADSRLPPEGLGEISRALSQAHVLGGAFRLEIDSPRRCLRLISWMANLRARLLKLPYGDQGYFVRKTVFEEMGGYREIGLMEDVDFFRRLKKKGPVVLLKGVMRSSSRRWDKGGCPLNSLKNAVLLALYFLGVSPDWLSKCYDA